MNEIGRFSLHDAAYLSQYSPRGNATVDNYVILFYRDDSVKGSEKKLMVLKGVQEPLRIERATKEVVVVNLNQDDLAKLEFFDGHIPEGIVSIGVAVASK